MAKDRWADADKALSDADKKKKRKARGDASAVLFNDFRAEMESELPRPRSPWRSNGDNLKFEADLASLLPLIAVPLLQGAGSNTGRLGKMIDAWTSYELRRAGFGEDEVWPRPRDPRIWPSEYNRLLKGGRQVDQTALLDAMNRAGASQADMLGKHYFKQVDVLISSWDRGPELMISTKAQMSSFGNNLNNRFEEFVGDAHNLKGRFPLAAVGIVFLVRSTIEDDGEDRLPRLIDMLRKLNTPDLYDSTCLIAVEHDDEIDLKWPDPLEVKGTWAPSGLFGGKEEDYYPRMRAAIPSAVRLREDLVPSDLSPSVALAKLVRTVLERTPVTLHTTVRERLAAAEA